MIFNWYKTAQQTDLSGNPPALSALLVKLEAQYPGLEINVYENQYRVYLQRINVPLEQRNQGIGSAVVKEIQAYAKQIGKPVVLIPEAERGKKDKLDRFYKNLDFVHNKGRKRNYQLSEMFAPTMYWKP